LKFKATAEINAKKILGRILFCRTV